MSFNVPSPPALILINNDLSASIQATLVSQLEISEVISLDEFNERIAADPNYPKIIHLNNLRILVVGNLFDHTNRNLFDVVLFAKAGLISVEKCHGNGPPGQTYKIGEVYLRELICHNTSSCEWCSFVPGCCPDFVPFWLGIGNSNILPSTCVDPFKAHILDVPAEAPYGSYNSGYPINNGINCLDQKLIAPSVCLTCIKLNK